MTGALSPAERRTATCLGRIFGAVALACLMSACPAHAGTYDVTTCANATGAAQHAFAASADRGMAAYTSCPNTPSNPATGIVTRASATAGPGSVPYFAGAYQVFEAPPGATLESVSFDVAAIRMADHWTTGIIAYDDNFNVGGYPYGCYAGHAGCAIGTRSFIGPVTADLRHHTRFRFETRCVNLAGCDISAAPGRAGNASAVLGRERQGACPGLDRSERGPVLGIALRRRLAQRRAGGLFAGIRQRRRDGQPQRRSTARSSMPRTSASRAGPTGCDAISAGPARAPTYRARSRG